MSASHYVGRIGGLAVALGVGAAVFTGNGVACASPASAGSSGAAGAGSSAGSTATASETKGTAKDAKDTKDAKDGKDAAGTKGADATESGSAAGSDDTDASDTGTKKPKLKWSDIFGGHKADPKPDGDSAQTPDTDAGTDGDATDSKPGKHRGWGKAAENASSNSAVTGTTDNGTPATTKPDPTPLKSWLKSLKADAPKTGATAPTSATTKTTTLSTIATAATTGATAATATATVSPGTATTASTASTPLANLAKRLLDVFAGGSGNSPVAEGPLSWIVAAASRRQIGAEATATNPTMVLNGYNVVATGEPLYVGSFYGMFTNFPGFQGVVQGEQDFDLVDPKTGETVGSFHGLVSQNNSIGFNKTYTQIVVTEVSDPDLVGTGAGKIPPVGSTLASFGTGKYGTVYSSMPTGEFNDDGSSIDVVKYVRVTPLGTFRLFTPYDASKTLTDGVAFNRPIKTQGGYTIVPADPGSAIMQSVTGFPPFFQAVQGTQVYKVIDAEGNTIGTFQGATTVTSDVLGTYTEAVYVTKVLSGDPGVMATEVPPVGSVYNVIYFHSNDLFAIYEARPEEDGTSVYSTYLVTPKGTPKKLDIQFDGAAPPVRESLDVPGDYSLKPVGNLQVVGINGLPPREAILQGYQEFEVYNADGDYLGTVTADRTSQWDVSGNSSEAVLVTGVSDDAGLGGLPPTGSVFNFNYKGTTGFGEAYYSLPGADGKDTVVYKYVTPFGGIQLPYFYDASKGLADYDYYVPDFSSPFARSLSSPLAGAAAGGALGSSNCFNLLSCVA
jgi:hypothetical protein